MSDELSITPTSPRLSPRRAHNMRVKLSDAQFNRLTRAAEKRGTQPRELIERIAHTVLNHGLIDAVLDDDA
jgi:hypothetical protein